MIDRTAIKLSTSYPVLTFLITKFFFSELVESSTLSRMFIFLITEERFFIDAQHSLPHVLSLQSGYVE